MEKYAQRNIGDRASGFINKIKEKTNIGGIASENLFNPKFTKIMNTLRDDVDDPIRAILFGEKINEASPPEGLVGAKTYLRNAKENLAKKEYMNTLGNIGKFHKSMELITNRLLSFKGNVDDIHEEFIQKDVVDDTKDEIRRLQDRYLKRKQQKAASDRNSLMTKRAGIMEFLIGKERGMATWEKLYPKQFKRLREDLGVLLKESNSLFNLTLSNLKDMAGFRGARKVGDYITSGEVIVKAYNTYDTKFDTLFDTHNALLGKISRSVPKPDGIPPTVDMVSVPGDAHQFSGPNTSPMASSPVTINQPPASGAHNIGDRPTRLSPVVGPDGKPKSAPPPVSVVTLQPTIPDLGPLPSFRDPTSVPDNAKVRLVPNSVPVLGHRKFIESLESMSGEHPLILAKFISKYATSIQGNDPDSAIKLFKMAKSIRG